MMGSFQHFCLKRPWNNKEVYTSTSTVWKTEENKQQSWGNLLTQEPEVQRVVVSGFFVCLFVLTQVVETNYVIQNTTSVWQQFGTLIVFNIVIKLIISVEDRQATVITSILHKYKFFTREYKERETKGILQTTCC